VAARSDQPASIGRRIVAVVVDGLVVGVLGGLVWLAFPGHEHLALTSTSLLYAAVAAIYEVVFIAGFGQTVGKAVVGIAVVDFAGENPTIGSSVVRYMAKSLQPLLALSRGESTQLAGRSSM